MKYEVKGMPSFMKDELKKKDEEKLQKKRMLRKKRRMMSVKRLPKEAVKVPRRQKMAQTIL